MSEIIDSISAFFLGIYWFGIPTYFLATHWSIVFIPILLTVLWVYLAKKIWGCTLTVKKSILIVTYNIVFFLVQWIFAFICVKQTVASGISMVTKYYPEDFSETVKEELSKNYETIIQSFMSNCIISASIFILIPFLYLLYAWYKKRKLLKTNLQG